MTYVDFTNLLLSKSLSRTTLPPDEQLIHRLQEALDQVATETLPILLQTDTEPVEGAFRTIYDSVTDITTYVRRPVASTVANIDIDEQLMDPVAYFIMAGLERTLAGSHMAMYNKKLAMYNDRQSEAEFGDVDQDKKKLTQFDRNSNYPTYGFPL